ncbi:MAG: hypothetical protein E6I38_08310 [Chloroflexi bacterium]|nr:MAG: hypothetical protein E6I38_08310 [Chloroflexota bacterium]
MEIKAAQTSHKGSGKYLVLADERANARALLEKLREVALHDRKATFTLLVPAKPAGRSLTWTEGQSIAAAQRTASEASRWLERAGLRVDETPIGDASPVQAIADILVKRGPFSGIIISTQPRRISRWLKLDVQTIARHRFSLPVIPVIGQRAVAT